MLTILVDVDDVVAEMQATWVADYNAAYGDSLTCADIRSWNMAAWVKPDCWAKVYDLLSREMYDRVEPTPEALSAIYRLRARGHRIIFVTATPQGVEGAKLQWLKRHGFLDSQGLYGDGRVYGDYVEAADKALIQGDVLIDDNPSNLVGFRGVGLLYTRPHNSGYAWTGTRVSSWVEIERLVAQLADSPPVVLPPVVEQPVPAPESEAASGVKYDQGKIEYFLLPWAALAEVGKVLMYGAHKYAPFNWAKGMHLSRLMSAAMRHLAMWQSGEDKDEESGLLHLAHAACCILFALSYTVAGMRQWDDRPQGFPAIVKPDHQYNP